MASTSAVRCRCACWSAAHVRGLGGREAHQLYSVFGNGDFEANEHQRSNVPAYVMGDFVKRLTLAYSIAMESGAIAAGTSAKDAEVTLKKLKALRQSPDTQYVATLRKNNLKRQMTIQVSDPEHQATIDAAVNTLEESSGARGGEGRSQGAVRVVTKEPRYGGAFGLRVLKGAKRVFEVNPNLSMCLPCCAGVSGASVSLRIPCCLAPSVLVRAASVHVGT